MPISIFLDEIAPLLLPFLTAPLPPPSSSRSPPSETTPKSCSSTPSPCAAAYSSSPPASGRRRRSVVGAVQQRSSADYPEADFRAAFHRGRATVAMLCNALGAAVAKEDTTGGCRRRGGGAAGGCGRRGAAGGCGRAGEEHGGGPARRLGSGGGMRRRRALNDGEVNERHGVAVGGRVAGAAGARAWSSLALRSAQRRHLGLNGGAAGVEDGKATPFQGSRSSEDRKSGGGARSNFSPELSLFSVLLAMVVGSDCGELEEGQGQFCLKKLRWALHRVAQPRNGHFTEAHRWEGILPKPPIKVGKIANFSE
ncbi:hypothetical protein ACP70R_022117 [Stipagrostis hirtigluma subsp. patula]